ncbi:MAG: FAD-binding oxidoreductase [Steroidobacteraceae bacterium]|nr:FAD-binding oxidoreductase [Nevskiaceae bacterium]
MDRRQVLGLLGATALAAAGPRVVRAAGGTGHVVVIGAGIVGATIAYQLARRGVRVTILEKTAPASGTTRDSFAYLNASTKRSPPYYALNLLGLAGWRRLQLEIGVELPLRWGGAVYWRDDPSAAAELLANLRQCQQWGYAGHQLDEAALRKLLPGVTPGLVAGAALYDEEGSVDPVGAVNVLLARARALGARVEFPAVVEGFDVSGDEVRAVRTAGGRIEADQIVIAAGLGSQSLLQQLGVSLPLTTSVGVLAHTEPQAPLLDSVLFGSAATIKQDPGGRIVSSSGRVSAEAVSGSDNRGARILQQAARHVPALAQAQLERVSIGKRVVPADGFPAVGFAGRFRNLYAAVTHSGVTLAPVLAQYVTQELLDGVPVEALAPYRLARFA